VQAPNQPSPVSSHFLGHSWHRLHFFSQSIVLSCDLVLIGVCNLLCLVDASDKRTLMTRTDRQGQNQTMNKHTTSWSYSSGFVHLQVTIFAADAVLFPPQAFFAGKSLPLTMYDALSTHEASRVPVPQRKLGFEGLRVVRHQQGCNVVFARGLRSITIVGVSRVSNFSHFCGTRRELS
jgi:hypothetical protein